MTEAKIYLGNLSYDTRERWIDVGLHSVVVVTADGVVLCQPTKKHLKTILRMTRLSLFIRLCELR